MAHTDEAVDWNLVLATGMRTAAGGPAVSESRAAEEVEGLREAATLVRGPVGDITGLVVSDGPTADVVDRGEWIRSNAEAMRHVLSGLPAPSGPGPIRTLTAKAAGVQLGVAFGWLSSRVLGQFEALVPPDRQPRLLLVAPNVLHVGEALNLDAEGFRTWVCVHEETHRLQFAGVPWMAEYFAESVAAIVADLDVGPGELAGRLSQAAKSAEGRRSGMAMFYSPQMRTRVDGMLGLMSLLEGHADWVMDQSHDLVPRVEQYRAAFEQRRRRPSLLDAVLRRLLGMEAKLNQYREGAEFVRTVIDTVGPEGFAAVWSEPTNLPTIAEIRDPLLWVDRVVAA